MPHKTLTKDSAWLVYLTSLTEKGVVLKQVILNELPKTIAEVRRSASEECAWHNHHWIGGWGLEQVWMGMPKFN